MECLPIIYRSDYIRAVYNIRELVAVMRPDIDFDSCFTIHPYYNSDELERIFKQKEKLFKDDFFETEDDKAFEVNDCILNGDIENEFAIIDGIDITANNPWNKELAEKLERVSNNMFEAIDFDF